MTTPATIRPGQPPEPVRQLRALVARGWHPRFLAGQLEMDVVPTLAGITTPDPPTTQRITALYQRLSHQIGPDGTIAARAIALGWADQPAETVADPRTTTTKPNGVTVDQVVADLDNDRITLVEAIARLATAGHTDTRIGEALGIGRRTVGKLRRDHNIEAVRTRHHWTPELVGQLRAWAAAGWTDDQIGDEFGMEAHAVADARYRRRIPSGRSHGGPHTRT